METGGKNKINSMSLKDCNQLYIRKQIWNFWKYEQFSSSLKTSKKKYITSKVPKIWGGNINKNSLKWMAKKTTQTHWKQTAFFQELSKYEEIYIKM